MYLSVHSREDAEVAETTQRRAKSLLKAQKTQTKTHAGLIVVRCRSSEPEVNTGVEGMGLGFPPVGNLKGWVCGNRVGGNGLVAQVIVKILGLPTPVLVNSDFNSAADSPSCFRL